MRYITESAAGWSLPPERRIMCDCVQKMIDGITEKGFENVEAPIELLSGRLYLTFTGNKNGQKKTREIPVLLSKCPLCGERYEDKNGVLADNPKKA